MPSKKLLTLCLVIFPAWVWSAPVYQPIGPILGYGNVPIAQETLSLGLNPAAPAAVQGFSGFRLHDALSVNPSVGVEIGDIGQAQDEYDAISAYDYSNITAGNINSIVADTNALFSALSDSFYVKTTIGTNIPFLPLVTGSHGFGTIYLSADISSQTKARYLDSPVQITGPNSISVSGAFYSKAAYRGDLSLGYSRYLMETAWGDIYVGGKFNTYYVGTNKTLSSASFDLATDTVTTSSPSTISFTTSSANDIDLGIILKGSNYQTGMSITNLGSPRFAYPSVGQNCASLTDPAEQQNCYIAVAHSGDISLNEVHVMYPQLHAEGALLGAGGTFIIATSMDLNPVDDGGVNDGSGVAANMATRISDLITLIDNAGVFSLGSSNAFTQSDLEARGRAIEILTIMLSKPSLSGNEAAATADLVSSATLTNLASSAADVAQIAADYIASGTATTDYSARPNLAAALSSAGINNTTPTTLNDGSGGTADLTLDTSTGTVSIDVSSVDIDGDGNPDSVSLPGTITPINDYTSVMTLDVLGSEQTVILETDASGNLVFDTSTMNLDGVDLGTFTL